MRVDWPQCLGEYLDVCWGHNEGSDLWTCNTTAVANQYCRLLGFNSASQVGAGALSPDGGRTRYISDGGACGTEAGGCSALTFVVCSMGEVASWRVVGGRVRSRACWHSSCRCPVCPSPCRLAPSIEPITTLLVRLSPLCRCRPPRPGV